MTKAAANLERQLTAQTKRHLAPRPILTVSEWASRHLVLSREASAEPGRFNPGRNPPMVEIMDAMGDPEIETVVVEAGSQVGKTTALLAALGYVMHYQPGPALLMLPTLDLARAFGQDRLAPMIRDTPVLRALVPETRTRDTQTTMLARRYPGGALYLVGANSAASLSSRPVRWVAVDEVDRAPLSIAGEGSPIDLAWQRAASFPNRKRLLCSSPTVTDASVIHDFYMRGDQRTWQVECPGCQTRQPLTWPTIQWDKDSNGGHLPETAAWVCPDCGALSPGRDKTALVGSGAWVPEHAGRSIRSYHLNALASPFNRWDEVVVQWLEAKRQRATLQVFVNTVLAEPFDPDPEKPMENRTLTQRIERYAAEVPAGVGLLTAGIDTQDNRLAVSVFGFGAKEESWLLYHDELAGSPGEDAVWRDLEALLLKKWRHEGGNDLTITVAGIDTGGHHTGAVYRYATRRQARTVAKILALKGHPEPGAPLLRRSKVSNREGVRLWSYGGTAIKDHFFARLNISEAGPGYIHLPDTIDDEYADQLLAERPVTEFRGGRNRRVYKKTRVRSEALDCALYAYLALTSLGLPTLNALDKFVAKATAEPAGPTEAQLASQAVAARLQAAGIQAAAAVRRRGNQWVKRW